MRDAFIAVDGGHSPFSNDPLSVFGINLIDKQNPCQLNFGPIRLGCFS
jgi:hypothetical protein